MGRRWRDVLRWLVSLLLLTLAVQVAGGTALLAHLDRLQPGWLLLGLLTTIPMQLLSTLRWQFTAARLDVVLPFREALAEYYLASLLNSVLPGGVAGDAARVWRHGSRRSAGAPDRYRRPLHAVMLERSAGQATLLVVLVVAIWLDPAPHLLVAVAGGAWIVVAVLLGLLMLASARLPAARRLLDDARRVFWPAPALLTQALLSMAVVGSYLAVFACAVLAVGSTPGFALIGVAVPLVLTAMALPVSVGGLGLREASAAAVWPLFGLSAAEGALAALTYGALVVIGALPALALPRGERLAGSRTPT